MIKKWIGTLTLLVLALAVSGKSYDEKEKSKNANSDKGQIEIDSSASTDTLDRKDQSEDTLVFDDWDLQDLNGDVEISTSYIQRSKIDDQSQLGNNHQAQALDVQCEEIEFHCELNVYPNPVQNVLNIDASEVPVAIEIVNLSGAVQITTTENKVDVSTLSSGIYFVQLNFGHTIVTKKFVKN